MNPLTHAAFAGLGLLMVAGGVGCRRSSDVARDPEWWRLEADRIEVAQKVELQRLRLEKIESREGGHAEQEAEWQRGAAARERLAARVDELKGEIAARSEELEQARARWVRGNREAALGRSFATFRGAGGRSYEEVVITRVTDIGIEFRHATGIARLAATDLTAEQRDLFGLEVEVSGEALADEGEAARAYASWVDRRVAESTAREEAAADLGERDAPVRGPLLADASPRSRSSLRDEPRSFGSSTLWTSRYSRWRYRDGYCPDYYYVAPVNRTVVYGAGSGFQNVRVPSANWSFTPNAPCVPTPVRPFNFTTTP